MPKFVDVTGKRYNRLVALERADNHPTTKRVRWKCVCDCGATVVAQANNLQSGNTNSCGCLKDDNVKEACKTHGLSDTYWERIYYGIRRRCYLKHSRNYHRYGGRGIKMCDRWLSGEGGLSGIECFRDDMGDRPSSSHSVDRKDVDGDYEPGNCRWATQKEQGNNTSYNVLITVGGVTRTAKQWSEITGIGDSTIRNRIRCGWDPDDAVNSPPYLKRRKPRKRRHIEPTAKSTT